MNQLIIESIALVVVGIVGIVDSLLNFRKYNKSENHITRVNNIVQPIFSVFAIIFGLYIYIYYV